MSESDIEAKMLDLANLLLIDGHDERSAAAEEAADEITRLRAEVERLVKSRNNWGQKYNKLVEKHKATHHELSEQIQWVKDLADSLIAQETKNSALRARVEKLEGALEAWYQAVRIDVLMEGPRYMGFSGSGARRAWELTRAALGDTHE